MKPNIFTRAIATFFFVGEVKKIPGTVGSLAGIVVLVLLQSLQLTDTLRYMGYLVVLTVAFFACRHYVAVCRCEDPQEIVIDEVLGVWITFVGISTQNYLIYLAGFLLFRLFDIVKPFGIRRLEKIKGGVGVIADDLLAGIYANIILRVLTIWI